MRTDPARLVDALAQEVLEEYGIRPSPIVDPWALAAALNVPVFDRDLPEDGRVTWTDGGPVVMLARGVCSERRRFTLAHELGHVILRSEHLASSTRSSAQAAFYSEEALCNTLAGAMLMPRSVMGHDCFARAPKNLGTIARLARVARVSLSAALVRLREVHRWRRTLLHWRFERHRWVYDAEAGLLSREQGMIKPSEDTTWVLSDGRSRGMRSVTIDLPLRVGCHYRDVSAEVKFAGDHAVALVDSPLRLLR
jgi:Zn-dependent peptidase ImmA (M78 family)